MAYLDTDSIVDYNLAKGVLSTLAMAHATGVIMDFDSLCLAQVGDETVDMDSIELEQYQTIQDKVVMCLDSIGVSEKVLNQFMSDDDDLSEEVGAGLAKEVNSLDTDSIDELAYSFASKIDMDSVVVTVKSDDVEMDMAQMPKPKVGYKRKLVMRDGKKVWINKRDPNKKVILSAKQRQALRKMHLKSNTGLAKLKRAKTNRKAKSFGL